MTDEGEDMVGMLESLRRGDAHALAPIFSHYRDRLRRMVEFRINDRLGGRVAASDVLQEAYVNALQRLPHDLAAADVPFFIRLRPVTVQRLIDVHRQHLGAEARDAAREVPLGHGGVNEARSEKMAEFMDDLTSPSQAAGRGEAVARVREIIDRLEPADHEVAALHRIPPAAASKRYVRAIGRLKDALEQWAGFEEGTR